MDYACAGSLYAWGTYALPKLHGGKRGEQALLCRVRSAAALAMPGLRFRERAHREILRRLWKARWGSGCSGSVNPVAPAAHG
jgi:hypothetical protein